jgi:tRNA threonylcarbamoyl adenosine modification protein (Sua5/YciO/YrdC/YwlC family)
MLLDIHPDNPNKRHIDKVVECLKQGGIIIYPTDTIYGIGCDIYNAKAVERICQIKNISPKKANLSFICRDLSHLSDYSRNISNPIFRLLKSMLPGPFTFILEASKEVPKLLKAKKDTVGIRVPDHRICQDIVQALGHPIMSASLPMEADVAYYTDPEVIYEIFGNKVDYVVDGGIGNILPSTVIDCSSGEPELIRAGAGEFDVAEI